MGSTTKTLKLLDQFSVKLPEIGLSEFTRLSGYDKATTYRRLNELKESGFLVQDTKSKLYRLGPSIARLESVREQAFPIKKSALTAIARVADSVKETCHVSLIQGTDGLSTLAHIDDITHGNRVFVNPADILPFHASASGQATLAFSDKSFTENILSSKLQKITAKTIIAQERLRSILDLVRRKGYAKCDSGLEMDVCGIAVPIFNIDESCAGAVAVATPSSRLKKDLEAKIVSALKVAAEQISHDIGGVIPAPLSKTWQT